MPFHSIIFFLVLVLSHQIHADEGWKKISRSSKNCHEKFEVYARRGEKFLLLKLRDKFIPLRSSQEKVSLDSPDEQIFLSPDKRIEYVQPSLFDGNRARLNLRKGSIQHCKMDSF